MIPLKHLYISYCNQARGAGRIPISEAEYVEILLGECPSLSLVGDCITGKKTDPNYSELYEQYVNELTR